MAHPIGRLPLRHCASLLAVVAVVAAAPLMSARATPSLVGTLTCTAEVAPAPTKPTTGWRLSCAFEQTGSKSVQHYGGEITGLDQSDRAAGKALLVWNVLAANTNNEIGNLVGVYKTSAQEGLPSQSLIGGRDQTIVLQPLADGEQNVAPAVRLMQLELPKA